MAEKKNLENFVIAVVPPHNSSKHCLQLEVEEQIFFPLFDSFKKARRRDRSPEESPVGKTQ